MKLPKVWEPLIEPFNLGIQLVKTPEGDDSSAVHLIVSGREPLLVSLTPSTLRRTAAEANL